MRTPNIGDVFYVPGIVPDDPKQMRQFMQDELYRVKVAIDALAAGHLTQVHVAPTKPRQGDTRLADGTNWNPGSGQGVYTYYNSTWNKLG